MKIANRIDDIQKILKTFNNASIALVPTMGSLHKGHAELIKKAQEQCNRVVVSIFVNPSQFDDPNDLKKYPRTPDEDFTFASDLGVDILFTPLTDEIYKENRSTWVIVGDLGDHLCGKNRRGHFRGVATIVAKLFNIIQPDKAFFGEKDWQQLLVVKKMVDDLNFPIEIVAVPTVRESSGLVVSSRNVHLSVEERRDAEVIWRSLIAAKDDISSGQNDIDKIRLKIGKMIEDKESLSLEYLSLCRPDDLTELESTELPILVAIAVRAGNTRLIDNLLVS